MIRTLGAFFLCLLFSLAMAAPVNQNGDTTAFDVEAANQRLDLITFELSTVDLDVAKLTHAINRLQQLTNEAQRCVERSGRRVQDVELQIAQYFGDNSDAKKRADLKYLEEQKDSFAKQQAACRLFLIKANEAIDAWRKAAITLQQERTFTRGDAIWTRAALFYDESKVLEWPAISVDLSYRDGILLAAGGLLLLFLAWFLAFYLAAKMHQKARTRRRLRRRLTGLFYPLLLLIGLWMLIETVSLAPNVGKMFQDVLKQAILILAILSLITLLFSSRFLERFFKWYGLNKVFLFRLVLTLMILYLMNLVSITVLKLLEAPEQLMLFYESLAMIVVLLFVSGFLLAFYDRHRPFFPAWLSKTLLLEILVCTVLIIVIMDFIGFHYLAAGLLRTLTGGLLAVGILLVGWRGLQKIYLSVHFSTDSRWYLRRYFGYVTEPPYLEMVLLKFIAQIVLVLFSLYIFGYLTGDITYFIDDVFRLLKDGFSMGVSHIYPMQWLIGLLIFCIFVLIGRHISSNVSQKEQFDAEEETQVALASIINYAGLAIAVIIGLLVAGFSFTSLAIIAGALSVGIGLGLQSIVNNFFSGLILLIEKPIKAGDRIRVNDVEGFVKKVRVRSTQVRTPAQEDVIIPNSDLISQQVTNFMFNDRSWRVQCNVGVAYGSDVRLVEKLLLEVGAAHPEVMSDERNTPLVFFNSFGDSALLFQLWCLIGDVNNKFKVVSDLNYAIEATFREHNISISFPQRDVHLHFDDPTNPDEA